MLYRVLIRLGRVVPVLLGVSILTFWMLNVLPGDPALAVLGEEATPAAVAQLRSDLGLDRPLIVRYLEWLGGALQGDFGNSYRTGESVLDLVLQRAPATIELLILAELLALLVAIPLALLATWRPGGAVDRVTGISAIGALSIPHFLSGVLLILVFAVNLGWFPATGFTPLSESISGNLRSVTLPVVTLALTHIAVYHRLLRSEIVTNSTESYIETAHAKGLSRGRVHFRHLFRNSLFALVTLLGVNVATLIGGAVIVETIFAIPGTGRLLIDSIYARDLIVVQALVFLTAVAYVLINLAVDMTYFVLDPRIRRG